MKLCLIRETHDIEVRFTFYSFECLSTHSRLSLTLNWSVDLYFKSTKNHKFLICSFAKTLQKYLISFSQYK